MSRSWMKAYLQGFYNMHRPEQRRKVDALHLWNIKWSAPAQSYFRPGT